MFVWQYQFKVVVVDEIVIDDQLCFGQVCLYYVYVEIMIVVGFVDEVMVICVYGDQVGFGVVQQDMWLDVF